MTGLFQTSSEIIANLKETYRFQYVIRSFVSTILKQRYRKSFLGFGWSLLSPLLNYGVIAIVYGHAMRGAVPNYMLYTFSGTVFFSFFANCINQSPGIMLNAENYIRKINVPKLTFVLISTLVEATNFLLSFTALVTLGLVFGKLQLSWALLVLPILILFGILFSVGIQITLSISAVFFRDLVHVIPVLMQVTFFVTPILYFKETVPSRYQWLVTINPLNYFVESFRAPLYLHQFPPISTFGWMVVISLVTFLQGLILLRKYDNTIIFKL